MPFLGVSPTQEFTSVAKQSITGDGSTSYTLNKGVSTENDLAVFVNDVRQEPGVAYTASANTITFTANLESTDSCYVLHIGRSFSSAESPGIDDNATSKVVTIQSDGHIVPTANVTYDLGTSDLRFRDLYLSGSSLHLGAHEMTANATHVSMGNVATTGVMSGNAALMTSLNADELTSGTLPLARLPDDVTIVNDLTIGGDFVVNGNTTTIAANELKVEDSLIQLATNNEISDTLDIGFVGHYSNDGGTTALHTGFFRDASDEQYYLFNGYEDDTFDTATPPSTIDRTANTFSLADLNVGGLNATTSVEATTAFRAYDSVGAVYRNVLRYSGGNVRIETGSSGTEKIGLFAGGSEYLTIDSSGNVGIGYNAPTAPLHFFKPDARFLLQGNGTSARTRIQFLPRDASNVATLQEIEGIENNLIFLTGGSSGNSYVPTERMRIDSAGNIGIGTNSPSSYNSIMDDLVIARSGDSGITLVSGTTSEGSIAFADGTSGADTYRGWINYNHNSNFLRFATNASVRMYIDSAGKIGVGNQNPSGSFHLTTVDASGSDVYYVAQNTTANRIAGYRILDESNNVGGVFQYDNGGNQLLIGTTQASDFLFTTSNTEQMRINAAGRVGIGTTDPGNYRLNVEYTHGNYAPVEFAGPGTAAWGIGLVVRTRGGTDGAAILFRNRDTKNWQIRGQTSGTGFQIVEDGGDANGGSGFGTPRVHISAGGNVGIGDNFTAPQRQLHVRGTVEEVLRVDSSHSAGAIHFFNGGTRKGIVGFSGGGTISANADAGDMVLRTESGKQVHLAISGYSKLIVDSSGRVTTPDQPSFFAYISGSNPSVSTSTATIPLNATSWNVGSHFNTSNYRFTAPVDGVYSFTASTNGYNMSTDARLRAIILVNGSTQYSGGFIRVRDAGDHNVTVCLNIKLSANDYVQLQQFSDDTARTLSAGTAWNWLSGYLLG